MRLDEKFVSAAALKHGQSGAKLPDRSGHAGTSHFESAFASAARKPQPMASEPAAETSTKLQDPASATAPTVADDDDNDPHAALKHHALPEGEGHDDARARAERPAVERREERGSSRDQRQPPQKENTNRTVSATETTATRSVEPRGTYQSTAGVQSASARGAPLQTLSGQLAGQTLALLTQPPARGVETMPTTGQADASLVDPHAQEPVPGEGAATIIETDAEPKMQGKSGDAIGPHDADKGEMPLRPVRNTILPSVLTLAAATASTAGDRQPAATVTAKASAAPASVTGAASVAGNLQPAATITAKMSVTPASAVTTTTSQVVPGTDHLTSSLDKTGAAQKDAGGQTVPAKADAVARISRIIDAGVRPTSVIPGSATQTTQEMRTSATDRTTPLLAVRGGIASGVQLARGVEAAQPRQGMPSTSSLPKTATGQASVLPGQAAVTNTASSEKAAMAGKVAADTRVLPKGATPVAGRVSATTAQAALSLQTAAGEQNVRLRPAIDIKGAPALQPAAAQEVHSTAQPAAGQEGRAAAGAKPATASPQSLTATTTGTAAVKDVAVNAKAILQATQQTETKSPLDAKVAGVASRPVSNTVLQGAQPATALARGTADNQKTAIPMARPVTADLPLASKSALAGPIAGQATPRTAPILSAQVSARDDKLLAGGAHAIDGKAPDSKTVDAKSVGTAAPASKSTDAKPMDAKAAGTTKTVSDGRSLGAAAQPVTARSVEIRMAGTPAPASDTKHVEAKAPENKTSDTKAASTMTTDVRAAETKANVATRMMPAFTEKTAENSPENPATKATSARSPVGERATTGTQVKPVPTPTIVLTPATAAKVADTTSAAPSSLRKDIPPVTTQKTVAEQPMQRGQTPPSERSSDATSVKVDPSVAGHRTETLTRSTILTEKTPVFAQVHPAIVVDHSEARTKVAVAMDAVTPRQSAVASHDAALTTHATNLSPSPVAIGKTEPSTAVPIAIRPEAELKPAQTSENVSNTPMAAFHVDDAAIKAAVPQAEITSADPLLKAAPAVVSQAAENVSDKPVTTDHADVAATKTAVPLMETTPADPTLKSTLVKSDVVSQTAENMLEKPVTAEHTEAAAVKADAPQTNVTVADPAVKAAPVDTPHPVASQTAMTAHEAVRQPAEPVQRPIDKLANDKITDKATMPIATKDDSVRADKDPATEPLPDQPAPSAAETLMDRLLMARSVAAPQQQAATDSTSPAFSLLNAATYRPVTLSAPHQGQPAETRPVTARSDERAASVERPSDRVTDRMPETRDAATPALPSASLADRTADKTVALPGTDQNFRFTRADGRGQAMSVNLSADGDRATITSEPASLGNRAETVTVLDSRRFLGVTPMSNAQAVTSLIPTDPRWADAMRSGALGELGADPHAATGKVVNTLKIQMHPIELGLVTATLRLKDDELHVDLKVETGDAYRQLSDDQGAMVKALRAQGFAVDQINIVYTASDSTASNGNGASQPQAGAQQGGGRERPAEGSLQGGERNGSSNGDQQGSSDRRTRREDDAPLVNGRTRSGDVYM